LAERGSGAAPLADGLATVAVGQRPPWSGVLPEDATGVGPAVA
jgi:hypothetical protein